MKILLKEGLENIAFGSTPETVRLAFGEPSETEELENFCEGSVESIVWYYPDRGLTFFFDAGFGEPTLNTIETENPDAELAGNRIFEMDRESIIAMMHSLNFSDMEEDDETWGEHRITFEDAQIDFYFSEDKLALVSWGQ